MFRTYTAFVDDSHDDLPADIARRPEVPFWSGQEDNFANQTGKQRYRDNDNISTLSIISIIDNMRND